MDYYTKDEVDRKLEELRLRTIEDVLKGLPIIVRSMVMSASRRHELALKFYSDNPDFDKEKSARIIEEIDSQNPGISYEDILSKAAIEIRRRMTLNPPGGFERSGKPSLNYLDRTLNGEI